MTTDHPEAPDPPTGPEGSPTGTSGVLGPLAEGYRGVEINMPSPSSPWGSLTPSEADEAAQHAMYQDIDNILARLENGIATERTAMNALLDRLTGRAA
jgi:hypothetical protein